MKYQVCKDTAEVCRCRGREFPTDDQYSHPEQRRLLHVPDFDNASIAAATHCGRIDLHAPDGARVLEMKLLQLSPCV